MIAVLLCLMATSSQESNVPTWHGDVEAIVKQHCGECHVSTGAAPFPLHTYEDVVNRSSFIDVVIREGIMPPWLPSDSGLPLQSHRGLSKHEIQTVSDWIQGGRPRGRALNATSEAVRDDASPRADLSVSMPEQWMVPAEGGINWGRRERDKRTFVLPLGNADSLRVQEMRYESSAPRPFMPSPSWPMTRGMRDTSTSVKRGLVTT